MMQDEQIVALFWQRDERAIRETEKKYRRYLLKIAYQILADHCDSEESVNDTYLKAWESMPPHKPKALSVYLGRITRQTAIDIYRRRQNTHGRCLNWRNVFLAGMRQSRISTFFYWKKPFINTLANCL